MESDSIIKEKCFTVVRYRCKCCGYETCTQPNASRHKKPSSTCISPNIIKYEPTVMLVDDVIELITKAQNSLLNITGNNNSHNIGVQNNITINLMTPTKDTRTMMMEAFKNPRLLAELKAASVDEIPSLIFRYTKGSESGGDYVKVDGDKVVEMDVNGREKKLPTSKYIKKVIGDAVYTTKTHVGQIKPREEYNNYEASHVRMARINVEDFNTAETPGHKKKEKVKVTDVLDKYSTGDHVVYKYPSETKKIIDDTVDNISNEIQSLS